jgi:hypothetical protein
MSKNRSSATAKSEKPAGDARADLEGHPAGRPRHRSAEEKTGIALEGLRAAYRVTELCRRVGNIKLGSGAGTVVPVGATQGLINTGHKPMKLFTICGPPDHVDQLSRRTKPIAETPWERLTETAMTVGFPIEAIAETPIRFGCTFVASPEARARRMRRVD